MTKPTPTKTLNPLHFEDLEPHRFEDLIRQLIYDFRPWRQLEATGRSGGDDGFDVRGTVGGTSDVEDDETDVDEPNAKEAPPTPSEQLWLIQCKRERSIPPKKLNGYLTSLIKHAKTLHGVLFVAACDFSKKSRDAFRERLLKAGVREAVLWGKAEIEDQLFRPKNDHLLFAYFGVSLASRRRSLKSTILNRLALKRQARKTFDSDSSSFITFSKQHALLRDASEERYPYEGDIPTFREDPKWIWAQFERERHDGLVFMVRRYFAYLDDAGEHWDAAGAFNELPYEATTKIWTVSERDDVRERIRERWSAFPAQNQCMLELYAVVRFDYIVVLDPDGDDYAPCPHVYLSIGAASKLGDADWGTLVKKGDPLVPTSRIKATQQLRIEKFPADMRSPWAV